MKRLITLLKRSLVFVMAVSLFCNSFSVTAFADEEDPGVYIDPVDPVVPIDPCAYGHDLQSTILIDPTCTNGGVTRYYCSRCSYYEDRNNEPGPLGHFDDDGTVVRAATCSAEGEELYHCMFCGIETASIPIPKLNHVSDAGTVVQEATATTTGRKVYKCVNCGAVISEETIPCIGKRDMPSAQLNTSNAVLSNIPENSTILVNGSVINSAASGSIDLSQNTHSVGQYTIQVKANASAGKADSDIQTIYTSKPGTPAGVSTRSTVVGQSEGAITGVDSNMEYKLQDASSWTTCPNGSVPVPNGGIYLVRYKATSSQLASDCVEALVKVEEGKKPEKPTATFNGVTHNLSNLLAGYVYSTNSGDTWTKVQSGNTNLQLSNDAVNQAVTYGHILVKQTVPVESEVQTIAVSRAATPTGISSTASTSGNNGSIKGVATDMQYRIEGGNSWFDIGSNTITGLAPNNYYIRRKASGTTVESNEVKIVVSKGNTNPTQETRPNAVFNAYNMVIDDISGCRLSFDCGKSWTNIIYDHRYSIYETQVDTYKGIQVYKPGNGSTTKDSEIQYITVTKMPAPTGIAAVSATATAYGSITGVDTSMQYRSVNSSSWTDVPGGTTFVTVPAGTYYLRRHGYGNALASDALTVVIKTQTEATPIVPSTKTTTTKEVTVDNKEKVLQTKDANGKDTTNNGIAVVHEENVEETKPAETVAENTDAANNKSELAVLNVDLGWEEIEKTFEITSEPVIVRINSATEVPTAVFEKAVATNTPLVLAVDSQAVWSVEPADLSVSDVTKLSSIDLGITENTSSIPQNVLKSVEDIGNDQIVDHTFDIKHEGSFGFTASLTVKTSGNSAGKYANLYWYNPATGKMEYIGSSIINDKSEATFKMNHASSYAVVVSDIKMSEANVKEVTVESLTKAEEDTSDKTDTTAAVSNTVKTEKKSNTSLYVIIIILILAIIAALVCIAMMMKKKR